MSFALTEPQLLDGSKTVTRRLGWRNLKPGDELLAVRKSMGLRKGEAQHVLGRIRIKSVRREPLFSMLAGDCAAEGFPLMRPSTFVTFFCAANKCEPSREVTRIEFELVERMSPPSRKPTARQIRAWKNGPASESTQRRAVQASVRGCAAKRAAAKLDEVLGPVDGEES